MNIQQTHNTPLSLNIPFADFILQGGRLDGLEDTEVHYEEQREHNNCSCH